METLHRQFHSVSTGSDVKAWATVLQFLRLQRRNKAPQKENGYLMQDRIKTNSFL